MRTRMCVLLRESGRYRSHPVRITSFSPHVSKMQEFHFQIILGVIKFCLSVRVSLGVFLSRQAGIPRISSFPIVFSSSSLSQTVFHPHPPPLAGDTSTDQLGSECIITSSSQPCPTNDDWLRGSCVFIVNINCVFNYQYCTGIEWKGIPRLFIRPFASLFAPTQFRNV